MTIYLDKINNKLADIASKDLDDIVAKKVYIPFLGTEYTKAELQEWLDLRIILLEYAKNHLSMDVSVAVNTIHNTCTVDDQEIADKILAGDQYVLNTTADGYDKLIRIILYKFITTEAFIEE